MLQFEIGIERNREAAYLHTYTNKADKYADPVPPFLQVKSWDMKIFLVRHASPDWDRRDIPYDIHPGPMLTPKGEKEAEILAVFLGSQGVTKLYTSPFERSIRTARIVSATNRIPFKEEISLAEWRGADESENQVRQRMTSIFNRVAMESEGLGPIGLVSHGGPIALLLQELGIDKHELVRFRRMFDSTNPLPPAGAWKAEQASGEERWKLELVFTPAWLPGD